jgi:hypothetical protein
MDNVTDFRWPRQVRSRIFILLHHLRVKLILTRETLQKLIPRVVKPGDTIMFLYHEILENRNVACEILTYTLARNPEVNTPWTLR